MCQVLLTAFEPYDGWNTNSSWLALVELTKDLPRRPEVTTRLYPVDYDLLAQRLSSDLSHGFDYVLHLGQAPGSACIQLESIGVNVRTTSQGSECSPLANDGPAAYQSRLPLADYCSLLRNTGIPAQVSFHAGTYLCNAALYLTQHITAVRQLNTRATFVHVPLDVSQVASALAPLPSLPAATSARAIKVILGALEPATA